MVPFLGDVHEVKMWSPTIEYMVDKGHVHTSLATHTFHTNITQYIIPSCACTIHMTVFKCWIQEVEIKFSSVVRESDRDGAQS